MRCRGRIQADTAAKEIFLTYNEQNLHRMQFDEDLVVIHDPQPAPLIRARKGAKESNGSGDAILIFRIPTAEMGIFASLCRALTDAAIFSSQTFARQLPIPQYLFYPCIDRLSEKNKELDEGSSRKYAMNLVLTDPARS